MNNRASYSHSSIDLCCLTDRLMFMTCRLVFLHTDLCLCPAESYLLPTESYLLPIEFKSVHTSNSVKVLSSFDQVSHQQE